MLWLWMQREGTLALRGPVDIHMAIGLNVEKEAPKLEQVYRVEGYSVYHRQGSEFADPRSVATAGFAEEALVRRAKVILHEDLHGDVNFALSWEIEEAIVTAWDPSRCRMRAWGDEKDLKMRWYRSLKNVNSRAAIAVVDAQRILPREAARPSNKSSTGYQYPNYQRQPGARLASA
jgi:hypothetical protein